MASLNQAFMEEYKRLDKLCRDTYNTEKGVTAYIDHMKSVPSETAAAVPGWNAFLRRLISVRHKRNQLSHDVGTMESELCSEEDIAWVKEFCDSISKACDPIALLEKSSAPKKYRKKSAEPVKEIPQREPGCLIAALLTVGCALLILAAVLFSSR